MSYEFLPRFDGFMRLGYQGEDDKGFMMGAGVGYKVIKNLSLRFEAVHRVKPTHFRSTRFFIRKNFLI